MIAAWMWYSILISAFIGLAAVACERMLRLAGRPARWAWGAAIVTSVAIPLYALWRPAASAGVAPVALGTSSSVIDPALLLQFLNAPVASPTFSALTGTVLAAWITASLLLAAVLTTSQWRVRREMKACPVDLVDGVLVRQTRSLGPAVIGTFPSMIVLPTWVGRLEAEYQELVLAHEQEHIRAGDVKLLLGGLFAAVFVPWNLPLWWQLRRLRDAVELDCDDRVIRSGADPRVYGELLLEVARHRRAVIFPAAALSNPKSLLARRIHKMMHPNPRARTARAGIAAAVATLLVALACETPTPAAVEIDHDLGTVTTVSSVYGEADVDTRPERLSGPLPRYPATLRQAGVEGTVMIEFVITPKGTVDSSSVAVVQSTNPAFEGPAKDVISRSIYSPGEVNGAPVSTLVSQQIGFSIAGDASRRVLVRQAREKLLAVKENRQAQTRGTLVRLHTDSIQPLVIVDGEPLEGGYEVLRRLNPDDIARIEVVKGDAAVEMWGDRAGNGVIQIFTKPAISVTARRESN